jgi:acetyl-CoA hydrolase
MLQGSTLPRISAEEAAGMIFDGATVGYSGFTPAGAAKATPRALAARIREMRMRGEPMLVRVLSAAGHIAEVEPDDDGELAWHAPRSGGVGSPAVHTGRHGQRLPTIDMQSCALPHMIERGLFGNLDFAVVEAVDVMSDGRIYLSTSAGPSPSFLRHATKVVVEINHRQSSRLTEMHDISPPQPPYRSHVPIVGALDLIGTPYATIDPKRIVGLVETDEPDEAPTFSAPNDISARIAQHIPCFLRSEMKAGRIPPEFLPVQVGAGNLANAVLARIGDCDLPPFHVYGNVIPDALIDLLGNGRARGASATSLTLSRNSLRHVFANMDFFAARVVLRPQEISNDLSVLRRLGIVAINSVLEADVFGRARAKPAPAAHAHACGSGDFVRNAYLSCLVLPSLSDGRAASAIVPMVSHVDHDEHTVQILVTEQGLADLRGLDQFERAHAIISQCAHPQHREPLYDYVQSNWRARVSRSIEAALNGAAN